MEQTQIHYERLQNRTPEVCHKTRGDFYVNWRVKNGTYQSSLIVTEKICFDR